MCRQHCTSAEPEAAAQVEKHTAIGDGFYDRHDYTNALIEYEDVVKVDEHNFKAHFMLGKVLMGMSDFEEALKEFDTALGIRKTAAKHASCAARHFGCWGNMSGLQ